MQPINRTTAIIERSGRRKKLEISVKRRYIRDWNTREWREIQRTPEDATVYYGYKFEILQHDLHLAFAPSDKRLPFLRITDPISGGVWLLWFIGWDDFTPTNPITPQLIDRGEGYVEWRLDETTRFRIEILGHLIRKVIILERRPVWNRLRFRIGRANALLLDGASVGAPQKRLLAFRQNASFSDNPIFWFTEPRAWDSAQDTPNTIEPQYDLIPITGALWEMSISLDNGWLDNATYPVYIDPTIILQPDATEGYDNWIDNYDSTKPDNNNGRHVALFIRTLNDAEVRNILIKFNLSTIPTGSTINSSVLEMYRYAGVGIPYTIRKSRILKDWGEGSGSESDAAIGESAWYWYARPNEWTLYGAQAIGDDIAEPEDPDTILNSNTAGWDSFDLTASTQKIIDTGINYGWKLYGVSSSGTGYQYKRFWSSDYSNYHPKLTVDYTEGGGIFIPAKLGSIAGKGSISPLASA